MKLGLIGSVLPEPAKSFISIIPCFNRGYAHFGFLEIGFELALFGFVFPESAKSFVFITPCFNITYVHFGYLANWVCFA